MTIAFIIDFSVLERNSASGYYDQTLPNVVQVVGHTVAWCYTHRNMKLNTHPTKTDYECSQGLIRAAKSSHALNGICIDGGMYMGARAYLQITRERDNISFQAFERELVSNDMIGEYKVRELHRIPILSKISPSEL